MQAGMRWAFPLEVTGVFAHLRMMDKKFGFLGSYPSDSDGVDHILLVTQVAYLSQSQISFILPSGASGMAIPCKIPSLHKLCVRGMVRSCKVTISCCSGSGLSQPARPSRSKALMLLSPCLRRDTSKKAF